MSEQLKQAELQQLKVALRTIAEFSTTQVDLHSLLSDYRNLTGCRIPYRKFGYTKPIEFFKDLCCDCFKGSESNPVLTLIVQDNLKHLDKVKKSKISQTEKHQGQRRRVPESTIISKNEPVSRHQQVNGAQNAVPFPKDYLKFPESIPPLSLADIKKGSLLDVEVGEVYSPSHFWMRRLGDEFHIAVQEMTDDINKDVARWEERGWFLSSDEVRVHQYCLACYKGDWQRCVIVRIMDSDTVKVRYVDYGRVESCSSRRLRPLLRKWAALPAQALRASLGAVRPYFNESRWGIAAKMYFKQLVTDLYFVAQVAAKDPDDDTLEVFLIDTSTKKDRCLVDDMILSKHADRRSTSALGSEEFYLYPRFDALEEGRTPSLDEITTYLRDGIDIDSVYDFRRYVPPRMPPSWCPPLRRARHALQATPSGRHDDQAWSQPPH